VIDRRLGIIAAFAVAKGCRATFAAFFLRTNDAPEAEKLIKSSGNGGPVKSDIGSGR
jgi:hypothetical protein